ncbi:MAG TPA: BglII/BstYI family type II restriction endonuclease [Acetobacteraceae bacterium]|nr:BglII/BstYI family type II restriction endonuclease [Acetobacteraceae bacterium]
MAALSEATIPIEEIIAGGGEHPGTQRLRKALTRLRWPKFTFEVTRLINGEAKESQSHEIDHVRTFDNGARIALEIEWNNKDPFYDRDLENFKRLHADGAISIGIIVTRGKALQDSMRDLVRRFVDEREIQTLEELKEWGYEPTAKQRREITERMSRPRNPLTFQEAFTSVFVGSKFGEATTHWRKLEDRVHRGVGNPCPLVLIGLPPSIVTFHEGKEALAEVAAAEDEADAEAGAART